MARASVRLSVCGSVRKACKHDRDWTVPARAVKLGIHTTYDKRTNPIDYQGQGSKVKVTRWTLLLNLVNTIQTEPFELGLSNLVHILLMTRGRTLLIFKVRGKGQGRTLQIVVKPCKRDTDWTISARTVKLGTHTTYDKRTTPIDFQGQGSKVKVTSYT